MKLIVNPGKSIKGEITLPGDKSISHRAALFASLADGVSRINNFLVAGVTESMLQALVELGIEWSFEGTTLIVKGKGIHGMNKPEKPIHCGNSGTTLRLLAGALTTANVSCTLTGSKGLCRRPMLRIVEPLHGMGAKIIATNEGTAPLKLEKRPEGQPLFGFTHRLPVASAQVKTSLLLAGLTANSATVVEEPSLSRDHTEKMLSAMGVNVAESFHNGSHHVEIQPLDGKHLSPLNITIPGDFSSAAFLIVAALVTPGSNLTLKGIGLNPTRTGLLDALKSMGADITIHNTRLMAQEPVGDIQVRHSHLTGIEVSGNQVVKMIDEFPVFAAAAAYAKGETLVTQAQELRYKESDRISSICVQLQNLGVNVEERSDGFLITGDHPVGGEIDPKGDHRLAMSMAVCGLSAKHPTTIHNAEIFTESYPEFVADLKRLGGDIIYE